MCVRDRSGGGLEIIECDELQGLMEDKLADVTSWRIRIQNKSDRWNNSQRTNGKKRRTTPNICSVYQEPVRVHYLPHKCEHRLCAFIM